MEYLQETTNVSTKKGRYSVFMAAASYLFNLTPCCWYSINEGFAYVLVEVLPHFSVSR